MSAKNRTDLKAEVTAWPETNFNIVNNHKPTEQNILDSAVLKRDVIVTYNYTTSAPYTIYFTVADTIIINTNATIQLTISDMNDGEEKHLIINKNTSGLEVTFANVDINGHYNQSYENTLTTLAYKIIAKGSKLIAFPLHPTFNFSAIPAPETAGVWNQADLSSPWTEYSSISGSKTGVWYRLNRGYIDIVCSVGRTLAGNIHICTLPSGFRPASTYPITPFYFGGTGLGPVVIQTTGSIDILSYLTAPNNIIFTVSIPLE